MWHLRTSGGPSAQERLSPRHESGHRHYDPRCHARFLGWLVVLHNGYIGFYLLMGSLSLRFHVLRTWMLQIFFVANIISSLSLARHPDTGLH